MAASPDDAIPYGPALRRHFLLEDGIAFLNHGSFGATPRPVLAAQDDWRRRMEAQPVRFMVRELPRLLRHAAADLAAFLGAAGDDLVFVDNATTGVNAVLRSLDLVPGDEVLVTDHGYPAVRNAARYVCERSGARLVEARLPFPATGAAAIEAAVAAALTARTRLAIFDAVTSPTAIVLPVAALARRCRAAGVRVLIDAAHAPGMLDLDLPGLGADWVAGNAHKWLFAPKGCGFLWADRAAQGELHPTVISHGLGKGFTAEFDWTGTRDPSAWLAVGAALDFYRAMGDGNLRARNHALAVDAAALLAAAWGTEAAAPPDMLGSMAAVRLPGGAEATAAGAAVAHDVLWDGHRIEAPVHAVAGALWLRVSAQIYNDIAEYRRLAEAVLGAAPA